MGDYANSPSDFGVGYVDTGAFEFGDIEYFGDRDVFETQLISGLTYRLEQRGADTNEGSLPDPHLFLVDYFDNTITSNDDGVGLNSLITWRAQYTGAHYLSARAFGDSYQGDYTVRVSAGDGTNAGDVVNGTAFADAVRGLGGNDTIRGNGGNDRLEGGLGNDSLLGGAGDDFLEGGENNDIVRGQAGNDVVRGGFQADIVIGGSGSDVFQFIQAAGSVPGARDQFRSGDGGAAFDNAGLAAGDVFDLANIDANTAVGGNQAFQFGGTAQTSRGYLWLSNSGSDTILRANIDNDAAAEFEVEIEDGATVTASAYRSADFIL